MNQHHLLKKQRTQLILFHLNKLGCANRQQLQTICKLGKTRNANRILKDMVDDKLLIAGRSTENIYRLSKKGRQLIGSDDTSTRITEGNMQHNLMRNDAYIFFNMPTTWEKERKIRIHGDILLIPDAYFKTSTEHYFIEVDRTQRMEKNKEKLQHYAQMQRVFKHNKQPLPKVYFITTTEARAKRLQSLANDCKCIAVVRVHEDIL